MPHSQVEAWPIPKPASGLGAAAGGSAAAEALSPPPPASAAGKATADGAASGSGVAAAGSSHAPWPAPLPAPPQGYTYASKAQEVTQRTFALVRPQRKAAPLSCRSARLVAETSAAGLRGKGQAAAGTSLRPPASLFLTPGSTLSKQPFTAPALNSFATPRNPSQGYSPDEAWDVMYRTFPALAFTGEHFGLHLPEVAHLLEGLEGAADCERYQFVANWATEVRAGGTRRVGELACPAGRQAARASSSSAPFHRPVAPSPFPLSAEQEAEERPEASRRP